MGAFTGLNTALRMLKKTGLDGVNAVAPLIVMMDQVGMKGDTAANAINKIMSLAVNAHKVKKANKEFGLSLNFLDKKGNFAGLDKLFAELKKITNLSDSRRAGVFAEIFGTDKETGDALAVMINKGNAGYAQTLQNMRKQADLQSRVNAELGTMRNILDAAAGSATNMAAALVGVMAPQLKVVADGFGKFAEFVRQVIDDNPALIKAIVATTGTVLGLVAAVKGVSIAIGVARAAAVVASANPLIAGAIGLAAAGVGAYTYFSGKSDPPKAVSTQGGQSQANINVNIANAPAGTRVETTSSNNTQIKSNVGYTYAGAR
jgi:CRISPR/Cas system CSM-associated protein Csm2 small subunit